MTRFEYSNTMRDLLGDMTSPGNGLPPEEIGNGFGNDANSQSVSSTLAAKYGSVAAEVAARATDPAVFSKLGACATSVTPATQDACARTIIESFASRAYRRPLAAGEADELLALEKAAAAKATFPIGIATVIEAVLQSPDFLYRVEFGTADPGGSPMKRPTGDEMATRLSYLLWGTAPDDTLANSAKAGDLLTASGVLAQATRMLDDPRSHAVVRFFFDNLLPLSILQGLERDKTQFSTFTPTIAGYMREETQRFLEYQIYQGAGTWPSAFTADYTFVNQPLAAFYGMTGVQGDTFQKVPVDTTKRVGFLLQSGVMTGTITTNQSNPVLRGSFIVNKLLCRKISLPTDPEILKLVKVPEGVTGATARERFSKHSTQAICATCHKQLDPIGFALENFDPVGLWRDQENGVNIDASSVLPGTTTMVNGPVALSKALSETEDAQTCFASHWLDFGYGRQMGDDDACTTAAIDGAFKSSGYNVKQLLLNLTQTQAFLYFPGSK